MSVRVHILSGRVPWVVGYTEIQSLEAIELLNELMAGSCSATMSMSCLIRMLLLRSVCWHVGDLLTFCCKITTVCPILQLLGVVNTSLSWVRC
jgi:hypothetical protein